MIVLSNSLLGYYFIMIMVLLLLPCAVGSWLLLLVRNFNRKGNYTLKQHTNKATIWVVDTLVYFVLTLICCVGLFVIWESVVKAWLPYKGVTLAKINILWHHIYSVEWWLKKAGIVLVISMMLGIVTWMMSVPGYKVKPGYTVDDYLRRKEHSYYYGAITCFTLSFILMCYNIESVLKACIHFGVYKRVRFWSFVGKVMVPGSPFSVYVLIAGLFAALGIMMLLNRFHERKKNISSEN